MLRSNSSVAELLPGLDQLWQKTLGDPNVCVAILDGPVDTTHPSLSRAKLTSVPTLATQGNDSAVTQYHGTKVTSIIFGQHGSGINGLAPNCRGLIIPIFRDEQKPCSELDLARAINLAIDFGADVINISAGQISPSGAAHPILSETVDRCTKSGILIVAAAGNDGCRCLHIPAAINSVLPVGATDFNGAPTTFSNWGDAYQSSGIMAPGENIPVADENGKVTLATGTSYATPIATGVIALALSLAKSLTIELDALQVRDILLETSLGCNEEPAGDCVRLLAGRINVLRLMSQLFRTGMSNMIDSDNANPMDQAQKLHASNSGGPCALNGPTVNANSEQVIVASQRFSGLMPSDCGCGGEKEPQLVYALGQLGVDFATEARRDQFAQSMGPILNEDGVVASALGTPSDLNQLIAHLEKNPWKAASLTWILSLNSTPIYAIVPSGPFASITYDRLRDFLSDMVQGVDRISVPGVITGSRKLASGQLVPAIAPDLRGMYSWTTEALLKSLTPKMDEASTGVQNFLERVYHELRNLGQTSQDRALNFAATNAFSIQEAFEDAMKKKMELDSIEVIPSPICRPGADCWDVKLFFFLPQREANASRHVYMFTVDVSDVVPVTVGKMRHWSVR